MPDYTAYGLTLRLPFACPVLPLAAGCAIPDVVVVDGPVPRQLTAPVMTDPQMDVAPGRMLWRGGRRAGRFLVEDGQRVTLQRNPGAEDELLAFQFLDAVLATLLRQRGLLVLHANAAITSSGAVAVSGESGAGKSTTLAALLAQGCTMLADDITALRLAPSGEVEALPGVPQLHLCEDAADGLGHDLTGLTRFPWRRMKAAVPTQAAMATAPAQLTALYRLGTHPGEDLRVLRLTGAAAFAVLQDCIYGPLLPQEHPDLFALLAAVADQVEIYRLDRPAAQWTVAPIVELILSTGKQAQPVQ